MMPPITLQRYADRNGCVVHWGNMVGPYMGQEFEETFATEAEAKERERQALALEAITVDRAPVAITRRNCKED